MYILACFLGRRFSCLKNCEDSLSGLVSGYLKAMFIDIKLLFN